MARTNYSTYMAIKRQLLHMFKTEKFERNKLPPESTLAARLGISLVTLREALLMLALEGYITKRHGSGNYIHPSALDHENRSFYFIDCLQNDGYDTRIQQLSRKIVPANEIVAAELGLQPDDTVIENRLLYYADDIPAILTVGFLPTKLMVSGDLQELDFAHVHVWIRQCMNRDLAHSLNEYAPCALPKEVAGIFNLPEGTPFIESHQTFYDVQDVPVLHNHHYFYPNVYRIKTLQNWDLGNTK